MMRNISIVQDDRLTQKLWGVEFKNPIGIPAGLDKKAEILKAIELLGFSFTTTGTVTPLSQPGNKRPRLFDLPLDGALQNYMGFNSPGHNVVASNFRKSLVSIPRIISLGVNKENAASPERALADYVSGVEIFGPLRTHTQITYDTSGKIL